LKVVLDTNVFISAVFLTGPPLEILRAWGRSEFEWVLSPEILREYQEVSERLAARFPGTEISDLLALVATKGTLVQQAALSEPICEDPDDDKFFATAVAAEARIIVSGDKHLLGASGYRRIRVLRPRELLDELSA
jgi:putative PIN family toxin of toxin-antitoxin system